MQIHAVGATPSPAPLAARSSVASAGAVPFQNLLLEAMRKLDDARAAGSATTGAAQAVQIHQARQTVHAAHQLHTAVMAAYHEIQQLGH